MIISSWANAFCTGSTNNKEVLKNNFFIFPIYIRVYIRRESFVK